MADVDFYQNELKKLLANPQASPGFRFALDQGTQALNRSNSRMRNSGNALTALTEYGTGLALQDYGNQVDRFGRLLGQEQQFSLGEGGLQLGRERLNLDSELGRGQLALGQERLGLDSELGRGRLGLDAELGRGGLANTRRANDQQFGLGMYRAGNEFTLGSEQNANTAQNNWWNYSLGNQRNANEASANQNAYNLNAGRNAIDWYNARTGRGEAQSADWERQQRFGGDPWGWY